MRRKTKIFVLMVVLTSSAARAMGGEWSALPWRHDSSIVSASVKNDDGGMLVVTCDTTSKVMSLRLDEPRARWQVGTPLSLITKADAGAAFVPSKGVVTAPTQIVVKAQSNRAIQTMGKAKVFFIVDVGDYSRIFSTSNFKTAIGSILHACGDH